MINVYFRREADVIGQCDLLFDNEFRGRKSKLVYKRGAQVIEHRWIKYIGNGDTCSFQIYPDALTAEERNMFDDLWAIRESEENCESSFFRHCESLFLFYVNDSGYLASVVHNVDHVTIVRGKAPYRHVDDTSSIFFKK